jgi:hypothetical protein
VLNDVAARLIDRDLDGIDGTLIQTCSLGSLGKESSDSIQVFESASDDQLVHYFHDQQDHKAAFTAILCPTGHASTRGLPQECPGLAGLAPYDAGGGLGCRIGERQMVSEASYRFDNGVKEAKERHEPRKIQGFADSFGHADQDHLASIPPFALFLHIDHHAQASARDEIDLAHIKHDLESLLFLDFLECFSKLWCSLAVDTTGDLDHVTAFELGCLDLEHDLPPYVMAIVPARAVFPGKHPS